MSMTTFFVLAAVFGLPLMWAMGSSPRRDYDDDYDGEWDRRYPPYPRYPYPPYPPRRRDSQSLLLLLNLVLLGVIVFIGMRYMDVKTEEKRITELPEIINPPLPYEEEGDIDVDKSKKQHEEPIQEEWFSQAGQYKTEAKAREAILKLREKFAGKLWLGINYSFDTQSYKVLIGPFPSEYAAREALQGDYPVRRPAQENIEIYRAD
ncbi:MAG: SPOR domain-containing protein [Saprospiraceae bacterium]|nr:SPOR domain-containing protein [Saprospiraceae bacterium]